MAKMGYTSGSGLGKSGDGRVLPVEAVMLPKGHASLDTVMAMREKNGNGILSKDTSDADWLQPSEPWKINQLDNKSQVRYEVPKRGWKKSNVVTDADVNRKLLSLKKQVSVEV
jgi:hypothetical protein